MNTINSFTIDTSDMPAAAAVRKFEVSGSIGSKFLIVALENATQKYYNFFNQTFEDGHVFSSNLTVTMTKKIYKNIISIPSGGGEFIIKLIPLEDTLVNGSKFLVFTKKITKAASDTEVTFQPNSDALNDSTDPFYATFPTFTSVGFKNEINTTAFSLTIDNIVSDESNHGFVVQPAAQNITEDFFFYSVTDTVNGAVSSSTTVVVDDLTGIVVGTKIYAVSAGSLSGTPSITSINTSTKTLTLSAAQSFANDITLTFRSYGKANIKNALGLNFSVLRTPTTTFNSVSQEVRANSSGSSTNVAIKNTFGIAKNSVISGLIGVTGTTVSSVTTADADGGSSNGVIVISAASITTKGQVLSFSKTSTQAVVSGTIVVSQYPSANANIKLDIDKFLIIGVSS